MKLVTLILIIIALAIPASASSVVSWTQEDITDNLTLNYTSKFNVVKDDVLGISIKNIGDPDENDTITVYKINVSDPTIATGNREGSWIIEPGSEQTIDLILNMTTNDAVVLDIQIHYNVSSENKTLSVTARYPGAPEITPWNNKSNNDATTLIVNISEVIRFNASADQTITTWKWYKDNDYQGNENDFITSWNNAGPKTIKVNATNPNGTSTITWNVAVNAPSGLPAPNITSWENSKTNNGSFDLKINKSETVRFNFTANQTLTSWTWTLNGGNLHRYADNFTYTFNNAGTYRVRASGANGNGSTQTIRWNVTVSGTYERDEDDHNRINDDIISWYPQVVDYIYVNDTISETIKYSITTAERLTNVKWTEDGTVVDGYTIDNTYNYSRKWDDGDFGLHTVAFIGTNNENNKVEFTWYVNVYEIDGFRGGSWFDVDYSNARFKMFKYKTAKYGRYSENTLNFVNRLQDGIALRQMTREALRDAFKSGDLSVSQYVEALKQIQREIKDDLKIAKRMKNIQKGIEEEDEEGDHDDSYQSERVKQNKVNKKESKEDKKKDRSVTSNSNGKKIGDKNNGHDDEDDEDDDEDDEDDDEDDEDDDEDDD